ncbi:pyroglutamyl-peptidase I [Aeromonas sp. 601027]
MMKVLITGFDPFGGEPINPAWEAVKRLPETILDATVIKAQLPTVFGKSATLLAELMRQHQPDVVINVGQAGGRFAITPERIAINIDDARIPDNEQQQPIDEVIQADGAPAYFSRLPLKGMVQRIKENGIPAALSNTAGTFVCNHIMYQLHYLIEKEFPAVRGGFIHVPYITEQVADKVNQPCLAMSEITRALALAIEAVVLQQDGDIKVVGGEIS